MAKKDINAELNNIKKALVSLDSKISSLVPATGNDDFENSPAAELDNVTTNTGVSLQEYSELFIDKKITEIKGEVKDQIFQVRENTNNQFTQIQTEMHKMRPNYFKIFLAFFIPIIISIIISFYAFYGPFLEKRLDLFKIEILNDIKTFLNENYKKR